MSSSMGYRVYAHDDRSGELIVKDFNNCYTANAYRKECLRCGKSTKMVKTVSGEPAEKVRKIQE